MTIKPTIFFFLQFSFLYGDLSFYVYFLVAAELIANLSRRTTDSALIFFIVVSMDTKEPVELSIVRSRLTCDDVGPICK